MKLVLTEFAIREKLIESLRSSGEAEDTVFFREMFIQNFARRADLVVANGKLVAFEIKSARDSLGRLDGQVSAYVEHFEQVTVVAATKHLQPVLRNVPNSVGVWEVLDSGDLVIHRCAPERRVTKCKLLTFLPVDELRSFVRANGKHVSGGRAELSTVAQTFPRDVIRDYVLSYMKRRTHRVEVRKLRRQGAGAKLHGIAQEHTVAQCRLNRFLATLQQGEQLTRAIPRRVAG